jgi:hypothetical protein
VLCAVPPLLRSTAAFFTLLAIVWRFAIREVQADADHDAHKHDEGGEELEEEHGISLYAAALTALVNSQLPTSNSQTSRIHTGVWAFGIGAW